MKSKDKLQEIRKLKIRIDALSSRAEGTASKPLTGMPHGSGSKVDTLDALVDLVNEYDEKCSEIDLSILPDGMQKIIWLRYMRALSWKEIQRISGKRMQTIFNMHCKATEKLDKH